MHNVRRVLISLSMALIFAAPSLTDGQIRLVRPAADPTPVVVPEPT